MRDRWRRRMVAGVLLAGVLGGAVSAAAAPRGLGERPLLDCGEVVDGALDATDRRLDDGTWIDGFAFSLRAATTVAVLMTTEGYAPYAIVTDPALGGVAEGEPPLVTELAAGEYVLFANNLEPLPDGHHPYRLSLSCAEDPAHTIRCGETVAGQLDPDDTEYGPTGTWIDAVIFELAEPTEVRFTLDGDGFTPWVFVTEDGDPTELDAGLAPLTTTLPAGSYFVFANNFLPLPDGTYPYRLGMTCDASTTACAGDCDGDGAVSIAELIRGVGLAVDATGDPCPALEQDGRPGIAVNELIQAVNAALDGCG